MDEFVAKYEVESHGEKVLWLPKQGSQDLLVIFSAFAKRTYQQLRWFSMDHRMNLLFIRDMDDQFYTRPHIVTILSQFCHNFVPKNVTFYGSSMGGYGAILHGLPRGVNILVYNPQIDYDTTVKYAWDSLRNNWARRGPHGTPDLKEMIRSKRLESVVWYIAGQSVMDIESAVRFLETKAEYLTRMYEMRSEKEHYVEVSVKDVYERINIMKEIRRIRYPPTVK